MSLARTGERLLPDLQHGELAHAEHLARYRFAAQLAPARRVLDAACGEGYGTAMLSAAGARRALGVDIDAAAVAHARARHGVEAEVADVAALPFADGEFDLVVSFETIEHVPDPERALDEVRRVLAPGGLLLISTPNKSEYLVENEFHVREFTHAEFAGLLRARFPEVRLLLQHNWLLSAVLEEDSARDDGGERPLDVALRKTVAIEPGGELYTLALCGDEPHVPLQEVGVLAGTDEAHRLATRLLEAERMAELWHATYKDAEARFGEAMDNIGRMSSTLSWRLTRPFRAPARLLGRRRG